MPLEEMEEIGRELLEQVVDRGALKRAKDAAGGLIEAPVAGWQPCVLECFSGADGEPGRNVELRTTVVAFGQRRIAPDG